VTIPFLSPSSISLSSHTVHIPQTNENRPSPLLFSLNRFFFRQRRVAHEFQIQRTLPSQTGRVKLPPPFFFFSFSPLRGDPPLEIPRFPLWHFSSKPLREKWNFSTPPRLALLSYSKDLLVFLTAFHFAPEPSLVKYGRKSSLPPKGRFFPRVPPCGKTFSETTLLDSDFFFSVLFGAPIVIRVSSSKENRSIFVPSLFPDSSPPADISYPFQERKEAPRVTFMRKPSPRRTSE